MSDYDAFEKWAARQSNKPPTLEGGQHFNQLTPRSAELLAMLAEECGEVIHIVGKILRHGYESRNPTDPYAQSNRFLLHCEIADVYWVIDRMLACNDLWAELLQRKLEDSRNNKRKYMHHQGNAE